MTFKFPRCTGKPQGVLYKKQQPPFPSNNIIWSAYIITTNTGTLYFDFQGMPMKSHSAWVLREIPITLHILLSQIPSSPYSCTKLMAHLYIHTVKLDWLTNSDKPYLHASFHLQFSQASSRPKQCNHSLTNTAYIRLNRSCVLMGPFFSFSPSLSLSLSRWDHNFIGNCFVYRYLKLASSGHQY